MSDSAVTGAPSSMGEPADRTALAWTRTSFAFLGNGALLMIRNLHGPVGPAGLIPAFLAAALALGTYAIALRRQSTLQKQPISKRITPRRQVHMIGMAVLVLIVVTTVAQLI